MKADLSKIQYERLLEIVFAGNWLLNSWREPDCILNEYHETMQHLFSLYRDFNANESSTYVQNLGEYFPANSLEQKMLPLIEEYNENNFTEELIVKMVKKEFMQKGQSLSTREKEEIEEKYEDEIRNNGVSRMYVNWA